VAARSCLLAIPPRSRSFWAPANNRHGINGEYQLACSRCGDFAISEEAHDDCLPIDDPIKGPLASHLIRRLQSGAKRPLLESDFFNSLKDHSLPTPAEMTDNLLIWMAESTGGRPGRPAIIDSPTIMLPLMATIGATDDSDMYWARDALANAGLIHVSSNNTHQQLTAAGWLRVEELKRAHVSSKYAFFARKFVNKDLDEVYARCLQPAVLATGYDLRTVTQKAGHIDAIIEDEIRRRRFLLVDLSDANAGAYWEAGFAKGLGKPVIYVCRDGVQTHFDTDHRHTVRWELTTLDETAKKLKAVIRNTLLGDAKQEDG
jgi:hypothetical protein